MKVLYIIYTAPITANKTSASYSNSMHIYFNGNKRLRR